MTASPQNEPNANLKEGQVYNTNLTTAAVTALKANGNRKGVVICNYHATNNIYFRFGQTPAANVGMPVFANTALFLDQKWTAEDLNVIASGAGTTCWIAEFV